MSKIARFRRCRVSYLKEAHYIWSNQSLGYTRDVTRSNTTTSRGGRGRGGLGEEQEEEEQDKKWGGREGGGGGKERRGSGVLCP